MFDGERAHVRRVRGIGEIALSAIAVERAGKPLKVLWMAIDAQALGGVSAIPVEAGRPLRVMHDPKVEAAIAIVIQPAGGDGPFAARDPGPRRDIFEPAIPEIAV